MQNDISGLSYHRNVMKNGICTAEYLRVGLCLDETKVELVGADVKVAVEAGHAPPLRIRYSRRHQIRPAISGERLVARRRRQLL